MGQTDPKYPIFEVAISCEDCAPHVSERKLAGDIIAVRRPGMEIGSGEDKRFLWLRLEGLEENEMAQLVASITGFDKRRYSIPLDRLKVLWPSFDMNRALDPNDSYQPFILIDGDGPHWFLDITPAFSVHGLVYDKILGDYL